MTSPWIPSLKSAIIRIVAVGIKAAFPFMVVVFSINASGQNYIYAMKTYCALDNWPCVMKIDLANGNIVDTYTDLKQGGNNGRGVAIVNNLLFWTTATSGNVNVYNMNTRKWIYGFNVTGPSHYLSALTTDGTTLWVLGYTNNGNNVFVYDISSPLSPKYLKTIQLSMCSGNCDGLEVFWDSAGNERLIANEEDGFDPYDEYSLSGGSPLTPGYLVPQVACYSLCFAGIAWDGNNFYTSDVDRGNIDIYDSNRKLLKELRILPHSNEYEDLAFVVTPSCGASSNLLQNGDFETGDFTDWVPGGNFDYTEVVTGPFYAYKSAESGTSYSVLGPVGSDGVLSQSISTTAGQHYSLCFWLNAVGDNFSEFQVDWNGTPLLNVHNPSTKGVWTPHHFLVVGTGFDILTMRFRDDPGWIGLDNVSVAPTQ